MYQINVDTKANTELQPCPFNDGKEAVELRMPTDIRELLRFRQTDGGEACEYIGI
jgi:hypothetical protein